MFRPIFARKNSIFSIPNNSFSFKAFKLKAIYEKKKHIRAVNS